MVKFSHDLRPDGAYLQAKERRLLSRRFVPPGQWMALPAPLGNAAKTLHRLIAEGEAAIEGDGILLPFPVASQLAASVADALGLPALTNLSATLSFEGKMTDSDARIRVRWYDDNFSTIRVARHGCFVTWGENSARLVASVFELLEAIDAYNASAGSSSEARIAAWGPVQDALKRTTGQTISSDDGYLKSLTVYQAGSFALDIRETADGPDFVPIVMGREKAVLEADDAPIGEGDDDAVPGVHRDQVEDALLPPDLQTHFVADVFSREAQTRDGYVLARNTFLVVDKDLKTALDVVREKRRAPTAERRAFIRNPRPAIAEALGEGRDAAAAVLFVETAQYSERVLGLGIWRPPVLPWLKNKAGQWLPESFPLKIGDRLVEMNSDRYDEITRKLAEAKAADRDEILIENVPTPVLHVEEAFAEFQLPGGEPVQPEAASENGPVEQSGPDDGAAEPAAPDRPSDREVLLIAQNFEGVDYEVAWPKRTATIAETFPRGELARTEPKPHQEEGFGWLVDAWKAGWPGVLLADDMGLGKTFQALAFLTWVRKNRARLGRNQGAAREPILIVAPTALLRNWVEESERHLLPGALGTRVDAFGSGLRSLKAEKGVDVTPEDALDIRRIHEADWVLTTYETLANYHRVFARVAFSVAVFDEAQKIKAPGAINTQSAKAMNADFVLALTGTPIENRLTDLWCIMDRVVPGYLGELKVFAKMYEEGGPAELEELKARLDRPDLQTPAVLLRRMKADILTGLPKKEVKTERIVMPPAQAEAYDKAVAAARLGQRRQSDMLRAIHAFRGISLHPDGSEGLDPLNPRSVAAWIARSARMTHAVGCLEAIAAAKEKALVFLEDRSVQSAFASAIATHLGLSSEPEIINGSVPGDRRLEIVDRFQARGPGFDILVLSPKAAGVGLTITAANHVIHLSRWWNPAVEDQCNDRVYRIGQDKPVTIHVPIAVHPTFREATFDVTLDKLLEKKRRLSQHMLMPPVEDGDIDALFGSAVDGQPLAA